MLEPMTPPDEAKRQQELDGLQLLDSVNEERFDRITRSAQRMFGVPIALISLIDRERQWFKSHQGLEARETPRNISFCGHAILKNNVFLVEDTLADARFCDNPLVLGAPFIRFYAGLPLRGPNGYKLGTLCLISPVARRFDAADVAALQDLGAWAEAELNTITLSQANALAHRSEEKLRENMALLAVRMDDARYMAEQLQHLNGQLASTTQLHQAILDGANFSIIATDMEGAIRCFNAGATQMLGYSEAEMLGRNPGLLHSSDEVAARAAQLCIEMGRIIEPGFEALVAKARGGIADEHEWSYFRKDGSSFPVMLSVTALRDGQQNLTGFLGIAYDLTERKRIEHMKSEFISTVSHELRTPLTSIRGSLGLLSAGAVGEIPVRARALLDIAKNNCERLVRLINDILDIEKIESGNMRFETTTQCLQPLVAQAVAMTQAFAAQFQVQLVLQSSGADSYVRVDPDRLTQVIVNFLSNACKFSPPGGSVEIRIAQVMAGYVRLSVIDHGEGISDAFRSRIFQKFAQADASDTRVKGGTGLGLNISRAIIERHQGRIDFKSERGIGSEFYFELPLVAAPHALADTQGAQGRVLICEDDQDVAKLLGLMLAQGGLTSDVACDAASARHLLQGGRYEAMTLDLALPGEDGISLLRWMRSQPHTHDLPVVVVSAKADFAQRTMNGSAIGVIDWLTKPIDEGLLLAALNKICQKISNEITREMRREISRGREISWEISREISREISGEISRMPGVAAQNMPAILYVEDDLDLVQVVTAVLATAFNVVHARTLAEARKLLNHQVFHLIVLDLGLSDGNGVELLASLPVLNAATSVVIFSAEETNRSILDKVEVALVKSRTSNEQLLATLHNLIDRSRIGNRSQG
jgi:PAS domain S-box-containing protein